VKPSDTARGREWLTNFLAEDQGTARELLDSIQFVRLSTMRVELIQRLQRLADLGTFRTPALLVPVLSIEDINKSLHLGKDEAPPHHVAYQTYKVGGPIATLPGSEGFIGNAIRDVLRGPPNAKGRWIAPASTIDDLRNKQKPERNCQSIVFVTDYAGSGHQVVEFARTFTRNARIRSWRSSGHIKLHAIAYAGSSVAVSRISQSPGPIDSFEVIRSIPTFSDRPWNRDQLRSIEQLCERHAYKKEEAFGYKSSRGLFATEAGAPNNLPGILRQRGERWKAFFEERTVPPDLAIELGDYTTGLSTSELVTFTQQARLARALESRPMRQVNADLLRMLAFIERGRRDPHRLAAATSVGVERVRELTSALQRLGLIDDHGRLTQRGRVELDASKRGLRHVASDTKIPAVEYYPKSMR
jgi:hypothetical protein